MHIIQQCKVSSVVQTNDTSPKLLAVALRVGPVSSNKDQKNSECLAADLDSKSKARICSWNAFV